MAKSTGPSPGPLLGGSKSDLPELKNPTQMVTLWAGHRDDAKRFVMHKDFACHYCPVFKAAFNGKFLEGQSQEYRLSEDKEEVVRFLVEWLYTQDINTRRRQEIGSVDEDADEDLTLVKLWILADELLLPRLQNAVLYKLQRIREAFRHTPLKCLHYVYEHTEFASPLREWFVYHCAVSLSHTEFLDNEDMFPREMLVEIIMFWRLKADAGCTMSTMDLRRNFSLTRYFVKDS